MKKFLKGTYFALILFLLYVGIAVVVVFSFSGGETVSKWGGATIDQFNKLFENKPMINSIVASLFVATISTVVSLIIGVMAAIGLSKCKPVTEKAWFSIANIPLINADVVTAVSLMIVFLLSGMQFGIGTLILAHISFNVPYVLITVMPRLKKVDKAMIEAGEDLGAKPYQLLFKVILPVLKPAIITAAAIAFAMSFDDFIISYFTGGPITNLSTFYYAAKYIKPCMYAFGTILVAVIILGVVIWNVVSFAKTKRAQTREEIKQGYYKAKEIDKISQKLNDDYLKLNSDEELVKSRNIFIWIHYAYLKVLIKLYSIRNYDKKISKLEWKQYKIKNEIRSEKGYVSRLAKTNKSIAKLQRELKKQNLDEAKIKKIKKRIDNLNDKKTFLESEIEWINNRDAKAELKAAKIQKQIKKLEREFKKEFDDLSKSDIAWYRKKIKNLKEYKLEVEEGKAHYKLRMTTERLVDLKELRNNKIFELNEKLKAVKKRAYIYKPLGWRFDKKLNKLNNDDHLYNVVLNAKGHYIESYRSKLENNIIKLENKLSKTNELVIRKQEKMFPANNDDDDAPVKGKTWIQRSWKPLLLTLVGLGAFSGLTAAYVVNNRYDISIGNWGEYIDQDLLNEFTKETGIKVNYQEYDSNESMYSKLHTFDYDLMVPSDYMVQRLADEKKIQKIDWNNENLKINNPITGEKDSDKQTIASGLVDIMNNSKLSNDKDSILEYAIPYFWGDISLVFNTDKDSVNDFLSKTLHVKKEDIKKSHGNLNSLNDVSMTDYRGNKVNGVSWDIVRQALKYNNQFVVSLIRDQRNLLMVADEAMNKKVNFDKPEDVDAVYGYTKDLLSNKKVILQNDDVIDTVINGQFDIAMMYSGDYLRTIGENNKGKNHKEPYAFVRPWSSDGEGTNVYSDNMVISSKLKKDSKKYNDVYKFINFMFKEKNEVSNSEEVGLASPNEKALTDIAGKGFEGSEKYWNEYDLGKLYTPWADQEDYKTQVPSGQLAYKYNKDVDTEIANVFAKLTAGKTSMTGVIVVGTIGGIIVVAVISMSIVYAVKKRRYRRKRK